MLAPALKGLQVVLLGCSAYLIWGVISPFVAAAPAPSVELAEPSPPEALDAGYARYAVIGERNLFKTREAPVPVSDPGEQLEESRLRLRLLGTTASEDPLVSVATIEDTGARENRVVRVGDEIAGARVVGIERRRVVIENRGKREQLSLDDSEAGPSRAVTASRAAPPQRARRPPAPRAPRARPPAPTPAPPQLTSHQALTALFSGAGFDLEAGEQVIAVDGLQVDDGDPDSIQQVVELLASGESVTLTVAAPDGSLRQIVQEAQ